jgi:hypothetical protein
LVRFVSRVAGVAVWVHRHVYVDFLGPQAMSERKVVARYPGHADYPLVRLTRPSFDEASKKKVVSVPTYWCPDDDGKVMVWPTPAPGWEVIEQ